GCRAAGGEGPRHGGGRGGRTGAGGPPLRRCPSLPAGLAGSLPVRPVTGARRAGRARWAGYPRRTAGIRPGGRLRAAPRRTTAWHTILAHDLIQLINEGSVINSGDTGCA